MEIVEKLKSQTQKSWARPSSEQLLWVARAMMIIGLALVSRAVRDTWPSITTTLIAATIFTALMIYCLKITKSPPPLQKIGKWLILLLVAGWLNNAALLANGGFMPSACQDIVSGIYCPMAGANLPYLGDWLWGFVSPGDVLMVVAFVGIVATLIRKQEHRLAEQV